MGSPEKKVVLRLDLHDGKAKQKAMKAVSTVSGIDSICVDMKDKKVTVIGLVDPVSLVSKLRKSWRTEILSIGPAKEPKAAPEEKEDQEPKKEEKVEPKDQGGEEKKKKEEEEAKKEVLDPKKEEPKQDEKKELEPKEKESEAKEEAERKDSEPKKEAEKKDPHEQFAEFIKMYRFYYPHMTTRYAAHSSAEEDPNPCTLL